MLKEILDEIKNSDYISKSNISQSLNVSEDLIDEGFDQLIRMGYIREETSGSSCTIECSGCAYAKSCGHIPVKTVVITEKGERLLGK